MHVHVLAKYRADLVVVSMDVCHDGAPWSLIDRSDRHVEFTVIEAVETDCRRSEVKGRVKLYRYELLIRLKLIASLFFSTCSQLASRNEYCIISVDRFLHLTTSFYFLHSPLLGYFLSLSLSLSLYIYIYIYIYMRARMKSILLKLASYSERITVHCQG